MPIPKPKKLESKKHFINRALKQLSKEKGRYTQDQRVAIAFGQWRKYR